MIQSEPGLGILVRRLGVFIVAHTIMRVADYCLRRVFRFSTLLPFVP